MFGVLATLFAGAVLAATAAESAAGAMKAGAAAVDITPALPISINGHMHDRQAVRVHTRLFARALVLGDGGSRLAIVVCDSCMIPRPLLDDAKRAAAARTGIAAEAMLVSATHTHSAPTVGGVFQSEPDAEYPRRLTEKIAESIALANERLEPAQVGWAARRNPSQLFNRRWRMADGGVGKDPFGKMTDKVRMNPPIGSSLLREPAGPTDPEVWVFAARAADGRPIALLANYGLHYVGDVPPDAVSADYFGEFCDIVGPKLAPRSGKVPFVALLSNGASGDVNNINFRTPTPSGPPFTRNRLVAQSVAETARDAFQSIRWVEHAPLAWENRDIELGVRKPTDEDLASAKAKLAAAGPGPLQTLEEIYARESVLLADYPATVRVPLQALRIGELGILAIPCEVFAEIGLSLKKKSPLRSCFTIELANGYFGYLPTPDQHALGGYETWRARSSFLAADASPKIESALLEMLSSLAQTTTTREPAP